MLKKCKFYVGITWGNSVETAESGDLLKLDAGYALIYIKCIFPRGTMLYQFDEFELDVERFELRRGGEALHVEPQTFDFLLFLIENNDRVVTREEIIDKVWQGRIVSDTTISSCVKAARKTLGDDGEHQSYIKTTRGRGFQFVRNVRKSISQPIQNNQSSDYNLTSSVHKQTLIYVVIAGLIFIIGLLLYNQYQPIASDNNSPAPQTTGTPEAPYVIAVMPFVDLSANGDQEYFGDGISEEVLNVLTAVDELDVTSRTTAFSLKGQNLSVPEIASRLNVNYIVEGSVRSSGNRIRITAQLIDARNDNHLWSENYDRELTDIFAIQDDISQQIADALKVELIGGSVGSVAPTSNMEAYALYLQGHQLFLNRGTLGVENNIDNIERAIDLLNQAVELDPGFADAWADLATSYIVMPSYYDPEYSSARVVPLATEAANKAIEIDPELSQAWAVRSLVNLSLFDFEGSEEAILRATRLNENNATAWLWQGLHFAAVGNQDKAISAVEIALELAPDVPINHSARGMFYHAKGDAETAIPSMNHAIEELGFEAGRIDRAILAAWNSNLDLAKEQMIRFYGSYNQMSAQELEEAISIYLNAYADKSSIGFARQQLENDRDAGRDTSFGLYMIGDGETFVDDFDKTFVNKGFVLSRIYNPIARPMFQQITFRNYLIGIGLLDYWKNHGFPDFCRAVGEADFECDL